MSEPTGGVPLTSLVGTHQRLERIWWAQANADPVDHPRLCV